MATTLAINAPETTLDESAPIEMGSINIRVVVLPEKEKKNKREAKLVDVSEFSPDMDPEEVLAQESSTPLGSYLESSKGNRCCVFLVNGQRQDALDRAFIMQDLGFRFLRNRMMIIVDVDGLTQEAVGRLMQGTRQSFYRGNVWHAMIRRVIATLKNDPDLRRLEEEAEEQVAELKAGDEKVKQILDQLIDAHHDNSLHFAEGSGASGENTGEDLGLKTVIKDGVVSLLPPSKGHAAEYPVLFSQPANTNVGLRPNQKREISVKSLLSSHWPALSQLLVESDPTVKELSVTCEKLSDHAKVALLFKEPEDFDPDQYPIRAKVRVTGAFNGIQERRQLDLHVSVKPDRPVPEPTLHAEPTFLRVSSREPVKIKMGDNDTHVRLRWDGKDSLLASSDPKWKFAARLIEGSVLQPEFSFSKPHFGRFSLLISPRAEWQTSTRLLFEVTARGPEGRLLTTQFNAEVVEPPLPPEEKKPRLVDSEFQIGANRRPPYKLVYIGQKDYSATTSWAGDGGWTDSDPGCFIEPTEQKPLTLIINEDMKALKQYSDALLKRLTETDVKSRVNKYTSHIAYHLYQMYQASKNIRETNLDEAEMRRRQEIQRVAMTLIKLMEVAR